MGIKGTLPSPMINLLGLLSGPQFGWRFQPFNMWRQVQMCPIPKSDSFYEFMKGLSE